MNFKLNWIEGKRSKNRYKFYSSCSWINIMFIHDKHHVYSWSMFQEKMLHFWFNTFFVNEDEICSCDGLCGAVYNFETFASCPVHHLSLRVLEAHRQRERFQSQVMESLSQLPQQHHHGPNSTGQFDSRSSWRCSDRYPEQRTGGSLSVAMETPLSTSPGPAKGLPSDAIHFQCFKTLTLKKSELDKANKDKQHKLFTEDFAVSGNYSLLGMLNKIRKTGFSFGKKNSVLHLHKRN